MEKTIRHYLQLVLGDDTQLTRIQPLAGGDINAVYRLTTNKGDFCVKVNDANQYPAMFETEAKGLMLLDKNADFTIPEVIGYGTVESTALLLLEYIDPHLKQINFWENFGRLLAELHRSTQPTFGLDHSNYIGSLSQSNNGHQTWSDFYYHERILPQVELARSNGLLDNATISMVENALSIFENEFPTEPPALLHGDLWSGNYMIDSKGNPCIIDPAVYYGHREMDLAMTLLFGGFDMRMYEAYQSVYPLEANWKNRVALCQLYPILVHVNLFGGAYVAKAKNILSHYQ